MAPAPPIPVLAERVVRVPEGAMSWSGTWSARPSDLAPLRDRRDELAHLAVVIARRSTRSRHGSRLQDKTVIVTGASKGIGVAIARRFPC